MFSFAKYQGAGNDFILIDDRKGSFPYDHQLLIQKLCHRRFGIGADGLILLQNDSCADFRMRIFNCNGKEAENCGNGLRCLALFIRNLGEEKTSYSIAVGSHISEVEFQGDLIAVSMGQPKNLQLNLKTDIGLVHFVHTGVPHLVHFVNDVEKIDLSSLGPFLRHHPRFQPEGVNVSIVSFDERLGLSARTFERGVEAETLACGTGAVAIAVVAREIYHLKDRLRIGFRGGDLLIEEVQGKYKLMGSATQVYHGWVKWEQFLR